MGDKPPLLNYNRKFKPYKYGKEAVQQYNVNTIQIKYVLNRNSMGHAIPSGAPFEINHFFWINVFLREIFFKKLS